MRLILAALVLFASTSFAAPVTPFNGGTGVANSNSSTIQINGAFPSIWTLSAPTAITLPTSGTLLTTTGNGSGLTAVNAATLGGATFAAPGAIGGGTPSAGSFTTLATSGVTTHSAPVSIATGVDTIGVSAFSITKTWNNAGAVFPGVQIAITDTASAATSSLLNISAGAAGVTPIFNINRMGNVAFSTTPNQNVGLLYSPALGVTTGVSQQGASISPKFNSTGTGIGIGINISANQDTATSSEVRSLNIGNPSLTGGAIIGTNTGIFINALTSGTFNRGLTSLVAAGPNNYNIFASGTAQNLFSGPMLMPGLSTSSAATTGTLCWTTGTGNVTVNATLACLASSERYKQNILDLDSGLSQVMALRPVSYELKDDPLKLGRMVGLVAEEVAKVDPRLVQISDDGKGVDGVRYLQLGALLAKAIQDQQAQIESLTQRIEILESAANDATYRRAAFK